MTDGWERAFVAVSVIVGEPIDPVARALGEQRGPSASDLLAQLGAGSRDARARSLAAAVAEVAVAIDARRLA